MKRPDVAERNRQMPRGIGSRGGRSEEELRRIRVAAVRETRRRKRVIVLAWKAERGCCRCGETDVRCLDAHHTDPDTKNSKLKRPDRSRKLRAMSALSYSDLEKELAKCECLCANCHRKEHFSDPKEMIISWQDS